MDDKGGDLMWEGLACPPLDDYGFKFDTTSCFTLDDFFDDQLLKADEDYKLSVTKPSGVKASNKTNCPPRLCGKGKVLETVMRVLGVSEAQKVGIRAFRKETQQVVEKKDNKRKFCQGQSMQPSKVRRRLNQVAVVDNKPKLDYDLRMEATLQKLHESYDRFNEAKQKRKIQVIDFPKPRMEQLRSKAKSKGKPSLRQRLLTMGTRKNNNKFQPLAGRERQAVPTVKLNVIRLLADLNVSVNKSEVIDTILPLFIDSLEEGDASPGLLHLRLLDTVSRMASLGSEKSYREAAVLMKRSYLSKLSSVGSAESKTMAPEATTEWVETLPSGFPTIASGLTNTKLRLDSRNRLLSLCSDVGLPAESRSGSGADFLGPLLPSVAEICSDFDPTVDVEPSLLKLFRNLWFYIALFGLAPPIQTSQAPTKSVSTSLNSGESMGSCSSWLFSHIPGDSAT